MRRDRDLGGVNHEEMTGSGAYIRHLEGEPPREYTRHLRGASMGYTRHLGRSLHGDIPDTWGGVGNLHRDIPGTWRGMPPWGYTRHLGG